MILYSIAAEDLFFFFKCIWNSHQGIPYTGQCIKSNTQKYISKTSKHSPWSDESILYIARGMGYICMSLLRLNEVHLTLYKFILQKEEEKSYSHSNIRQRNF